MTDVQGTLRRTRWMEAFFATIALYLSLSLPVPPPDARATYLVIHWYGMVVIAIWLLFALRRPSRATWAVAAALSVYFLLNFLAGLGRFRETAEDPARQYAGPAIVLSYIIVSSAALVQLIVAIQCWRTRSIWTMRTSPSSSLPVA